ncbi:hypothetical protein [Microbacterium sp. CH12i]|uniref:hypothetical protein n=1 Tax=Microbacterium sp. CH12i TaxID=1479651 RepID=UPI000B16387C|nr:hypothetical protein [Microbacterium sp. CH12i]
MATNNAWTEPVSNDTKAICERLDAIHSLLERIAENSGSQGIGWTGEDSAPSL